LGDEEAKAIGKKTVDWIDVSRTNDERAAVALEVAKRSADHANHSVEQLQGKADAHFRTMVGLLPFAIGATGLAFRLAPWSVEAWLFLGVDVLLLVSAAHSYHAAGPILVGGINVGRLHWDDRTKLAGIKCDEALAWHRSALLAMDVGANVGTRLARARFLLVAAVISAAVATPLLASEASDRAKVAPTVTIAPYPSAVAVPKMTGMSLRHARSALVSAGLTPGVPGLGSGVNEARFLVSAQDPRAGTIVLRGTTVSLTVIPRP
jgi:hypothetical protein